MLLYRIERIDDPAKGAYACYDSPVRRASIIARNYRLPCPYSMPEPHEEGLNRHEGLCAFPSLKAYQRWFPAPQMREVLYDDMYHMRVYNVPDEHVQHSDNQAIFSPHHATDIRVATKEERL